VWVSLRTVGLVIREFDPDPALRSVIIRASDFQERAETPVRRSEGPMLGVVLIVSLGPDIEVAGERIGSFAAGLWDRPVTSGHFGEQAGYELSRSARCPPVAWRPDRGADQSPRAPR